ncbi:MAG: AtpZ/AtpI family protein [Thermomicrobiales bacterium]
MTSERPESPIDSKELGTLGIASGLGCSIVASLVVFIVGGIFLDRMLGTAPILLLVGVGIGLIAAGYQLYELTQLGTKKGSAGPLSRAIERRVSSRKTPKEPLT